MRLFYCRVAWMKYYKGRDNDYVINGGSWNPEDKHEIYNFLECEGKYHGFVEPGRNSSIHVERLGASSKDDHVDDVLVIWLAKNETKGQRIVGWYKNATVYRKMQNVPDDVLSKRARKECHFFNIYSEDARLLDVGERNKLVEGIGQKNYWYGDQGETDRQVIEYIEQYENGYKERINRVEENIDDLEGKTREAVIQSRVNQDQFRKRLLLRYGKCCLCQVTDEHFLIASHIKPWSESDGHEKLNIDNGLLLCPNHDKLFDSGYISFDDSGKILISEKLSKHNQMCLNVNSEMRVPLGEGNIEFVKYHRNNKFEG